MKTREEPAVTEGLTVQQLLDLLDTLSPEARELRVVAWEESGHCYRPVRLVRLCRIDGTRELLPELRIDTSEAAIGFF
jgi:hypothetical protein